MLRGKKDELIRLLSSRKRKLSELYYATVNLGDVETTTINPQYLEKERLFLEANDIQKGRFFDVSTLPPRPQVVPPPRLETSLQISKNPPTTHTSLQDDSRAAKPSPNGALSQDHVADPKGRLDSPTHVHSDKDATANGGNCDGEDLTLNFRAKKRKNDVDSLNSWPVEQIQEHVSVDKSSEQQDLRGLPDEEEISRSSGANQQEGRPDGELRPGSPLKQAILEKPPRERSPLVLAPVSAFADPQSSPASTNGAGSTNTPDAAAGSPTTSPGDEHAPGELNSLGHNESTGMTSGADKSVHQTQSSRPKSKPPDDAAPMLPPADISRESTAQQCRNSILSSSDPSGSASTSSRRPIMRIDTQTLPSSSGQPKESSTITESPMSVNSVFPPRKVHSTASFSIGQSPPCRITRISSGTIRHRSVSEILGERPKPPSPGAERSGNQNSVSSAAKEAFDSFTLQSRSTDRKGREKDRSKLSTVVFAKPQHANDSGDSTELLRKVSSELALYTPEERDYLHILFESKAYSPPRGQSLNTLLQSAHKALSTADHLVDYQEQMNCRTLKRIYQLQNAGRWSLRQMQRAPEPVRPTSHWDFLLDHAKWMRTDFREERKWKMAAAQGLAEWCAEWVSSSPRRRKQLQVKVRLPEPASNCQGEDVQMGDEHEAASSPVQQTPDLVPSAEDESVSDGYMDEVMDLRLSFPPAAIFSLGASDFSFPMAKTPATDKLLNELPFYEPARIEPDLSQSDLAERSDSKWKTDIIPISRFAIEKVQYCPPKPPTKRSRYEYEEEAASSKESKPLPPEQTNVALFMPENKHIRDRIHPGHSFRPPSEYTMPAQAFFESRTSSQWTQVEDDELRKFVKDYSYNWSLISSCLSTTSPFHSGADRRTPWECFERWINLEGLPADMSKTPYFRAYHSRIEAAGRHVIAQQEAAQRQASGNPALIARKRTTQPVRVERKKNQRHLAMLDAMRKLAKKRETALQKQQHAADLAAMRKANDADRPRPPFSTPAEFSRLKHERDVKLAERQEIYRLQVLAQQKAAMQQRTAQMNQANGLPNGHSRSSSGLQNGGLAGPSTSGMPNGLSGALGPSNQSRPQPGMQGLPNGVLSNGAFSGNMMGPKGLTQTQMQTGIAAGRGLGNSPEHMRVLYEANRLQQQQQMMLAARQQHHHQQQGSTGSAGQRSSPNMPNAGMAGANGNPNSPAFLAALAASNGVPSPSMPVGNASNVGNVGSPRLSNGHPLSSGMTPAISQLVIQIQRQNPELSPDEVQRVATSQLNLYRQQQATHGVSQKSMNQAALNAAAGAVNAGAHAANASSYGRQQGMMTNEQVQAYNAQLRQQQAAQRANGGYGANLGAGLGMNMNGNLGGMSSMAGFTGSPVLNMSRPVSNHAIQGQLSRSATPRDQRGSSSGVMAQGSPRAGQGQI